MVVQMDESLSYKEFCIESKRLATDLKTIGTKVANASFKALKGGPTIYKDLNWSTLNNVKE